MVIGDKPYSKLIREYKKKGIGPDVKARMKKENKGIVKKLNKKLKP